MAINQQLMDVLVCPQCKGQLSQVEGGAGLLCNACELKYPVRDGIPVMIASEAVDLSAGGAQGGLYGGGAPAKTFRITDGASRGMVFHLEKGTCKVIGRAISDPDKTTMFAVDVNLALDESTKRIVQQYISKQFRKSGRKSGGLDAFKRTSDVILDDSSASRLHAMIFYDDAGVGILDLVSKNGTFVNGEEVESRILVGGDTIEIGECRIVVEG